jgi:4-hydroxythreonine-4-phosphate dehydrogenase
MTIGITLGDITGIGPEVALKAVAQKLPADETRYVLIGDTGTVQRLNAQLALTLTLPTWNHAAAGSARVCIHDPTPALRPGLPPGAPDAAQAAVAWLREGASLCLSGKLDGLVTAPVNKESIIRAGHRGFTGQTELLSEIAGATRTAMMLLGCDERGRWLRVALVTTHLPLKNVPAAITREAVERTIGLASEACSLLALPRRRIGVCGLNPHAGEGGEMGREEIDHIAPAVAAAQRLGLDARGPYAADTLFHYAFRGDYDAIVAMYHDQGLAPLKMIGFDTGVNWTLGLPFVRTSPDHGTAYDIAGQGVARPASMVAALRLAKQIARARVLPPSAMATEVSRRAGEGWTTQHA